jgi:hypothetical protein
MVHNFDFNIMPYLIKIHGGGNNFMISEAEVDMSSTTMTWLNFCGTW